MLSHVLDACQQDDDYQITPYWLHKILHIQQPKAAKICPKFQNFLTTFCQKVSEKSEESHQKVTKKSEESDHFLPKTEASNPRGSIKEEREIEREKDTLGRFDEFWFAYPKKVGKAAVKRHWVRHGLDKRAGEIIDAVKCHKNSAGWLKDGGRYIPNPLTYLNQGRWDDEIQDEVLESALPEKGWI